MDRQSRVVVVGAGIGGLAAGLELARRGYDVVILERQDQAGGKASERRLDGWRWDQGPSIVVMPWVYRELFAAAGLDPDAYLPMRRLDPAFRVILSDGQALDIPAAEAGLADALAAIDPHDGQALGPFLAKVDRFAKAIGHAYCDRIVESWPQVLLSPLMSSAALVSPFKKYTAEIDEHFRNPAVRELMYGFPTYSGFDPRDAPASLVIVPWTIIREGVWYPEQGGIRAIPVAIERACRDLGVTILTGVEVEAIERDSRGAVQGVVTSGGFFDAAVVVSNSDHVHTHRLLKGGPPLRPEAAKLRDGQARPSTSFFTLQVALERTYPDLVHHLLVLTPGSDRIYDEIFHQGRYASDPPLYVNTTSATDPGDAPAGGANPFVVINAPAIGPDHTIDRDFERAYADRALARLEGASLPGLRANARDVLITGPGEFRDRFHAFRGSIYGLGPEHNILSGGFRPLPFLTEVPGLYLVGGGVQPGPGMPMVTQGGKIVAARIARDFPPPRRPRPVR